MKFLQVSLLGTSHTSIYKKNGMYLVEFWLILERDLVEHGPHGMFFE
jgi:hypothetical protein